MSTYIRVSSSPASVGLDQHSQPATLHVTGSGIRMTDRLAAAIDAVCNKGVSLRRAAAQFGIAKSTLHDYVSGKVKTGHKGPSSGVAMGVLGEQGPLQNFGAWSQSSSRRLFTL